MIGAIITIVVVIFSIVLHEVSHGYAANALGDPTARLQGRLTLNPLSHLDLFGSILVPAIIWISSHGSFIFGWAKPVPYNPYNLKAGRFSEAYVAGAGPAVNLLLALIFGLSVRLLGLNVSQNMLDILKLITVTNLALAVFNLIPAPPLDGSKILASLLPFSSVQKFRALERYGFIFVFLIILIGWRFITPLIGYLFTLITGVNF